MTLMEKANTAPVPAEHAVVRSWISAIQAEVHACLNDETACQIALEHSDAQLENNMGYDRFQTGFGVSRLAGYRGVCYVRLGQPKQAPAILSKSLQELAPLSERRCARILADMATTHAQLGEVEEACHLAGEALTDSRRVRHNAVVPRLQRFRETVSPWQDHAAVHHFDEQQLLA